jgi:thymidylate synthase (FAD)
MKAELIDTMGNDLTVVNAARVSFDKESEWEWSYDGNGDEALLAEKDQKLINYLAKHNHWTPFSHVMITMRETVPIFVARQRFKHMVGFTYNEVSRRYVDTPPEFFIPESWRKAAENKKQGSSDESLIGLDADSAGFHYEELIQYAKEMYTMLINMGVAPEQARMVLPQSMYTSYYVTGSLAAWARAYKLRIDPHAQKEIQDLAVQWGDIIGAIPELKYSWEALTK